jgi:hypothetical protein
MQLNEKIDYLLLSPALQRKVEAVDVFRKGYYAPGKWESFNRSRTSTRGTAIRFRLRTIIAFGRS